jgi:hypothetical protein
MEATDVDASAAFMPRKESPVPGSEETGIQTSARYDEQWADRNSVPSMPWVYAPNFRLGIFIFVAFQDSHAYG